MKRINYQVISFAVIVIGVLFVLFNTSNTYATHSGDDSTDPLIALSDDVDYRAHARNSIYFWEPCPPSGDSSDAYGSGACGQTLTAKDPMSRLREAVEKFGGFAMDMQVEYGVPWEAVFFHMYGESQMGLAGLATQVENCGYYNTMGYVYSDSSLYGLTKEQMGNCAPHHGDNGALAAQFPSYEDMIMSYYTDYARNGLYDSAFKYLDPKNYDLEGFLKTESDIYSAAGWDGRVPGYGAYKDVWNTVKNVIWDVAKQKGWPTSKELAKEKNIPIGGKHPVNGDIKKQLGAAPHSLSACDEISKVADSDDDNNTSDDDDSDSDSDSDSDRSSTSFKIDGNTSAFDFWFFEQDWNNQSDPTPVSSQAEVLRDSKLDKNFAHMPYIYADNYDISYTPWPPKLTPNGGKSKRKYYWIVLPDKAFAKNMGDKYVAYFENRKEPVYFITYDVWSCNDQPNKNWPNSNYCGDAQTNPDKVVLGAHSLGYPGIDGVSYDEMKKLSQKLGKLTCLHRLTDYDKPLVPESVKCSGATCRPAEQDYPEYRQQTDHTCGPTSMAMLATVAAGKKVSESDVIDVVGGDRAYADTVGSGMVALDKKVGDKYKFDVKQVKVDEGSKKDVIDKMRKYLKDGYMIHFSGCGSTPPISTTGSCHYLGIFNIDDDDNVLVADSSSRGNKKYKLSDVINAGYHGDSFSAIEGGGGNAVCNDDGDDDDDTQCRRSDDSDDEEGGGSCSNKVLDTIDAILDLAAKNGSNYVYGGGHGDTSYFDSILKNGASIDVDCTGFASLVMYAAFGADLPFDTYSIANNPNYVEVPKSDVQPGDIFAYNTGCRSAHGGIVAGITNGTITKIAQTGVRGGYVNIGVSGNNHNIGYTEDKGGNNGNLGCVNGANDVKYYRYKGCK